jgi:hypothetical protein
MFLTDQPTNPSVGNVNASRIYFCYCYAKVSAKMRFEGRLIHVDSENLKEKYLNSCNFIQLYISLRNEKDYYLQKVFR